MLYAQLCGKYRVFLSVNLFAGLPLLDNEAKEVSKKAKQNNEKAQKRQGEVGATFAALLVSDPQLLERQMAEVQRLVAEVAVLETGL